MNSSPIFFQRSQPTAPRGDMFSEGVVEIGTLAPLAGQFGRGSRPCYFFYYLFYYSFSGGVVEIGTLARVAGQLGQEVKALLYEPKALNSVNV